MKKIIRLSIIVFLLPIQLFCQIPDLGTASRFSLFTSVGEFSSTGFSDVTGDVGTNAGAFSAFPPGTLNGEIQVVNSISAQAALDIETVYGEISAITCGEVIGINLGNDQILTPNVYCIGAASSLDGILTLDGEGNPDAVFIIKIDGALSVHDFSTVNLINSALTKNVFWQINGQFDLAENCIFEGSVIVNGAINLYGSSVLHGRALSRNGAISINSNSITMKSTTLPIELLSFTVTSVGKNVKIDWATASETNNEYFIVQQSENGILFTEIQQIRGAGNSNILINYSILDKNPSSGISYYRIKQTDFDGNFTFSNLAVINRKKDIPTKIYPNPYSEFTTICIDESMDLKNTELKIFNIIGDEMLSFQISKPITRIETNSLQSGMYFYKVFTDSHEVSSGKLIYDK